MADDQRATVCQRMYELVDLICDGIEKRGRVWELFPHWMRACQVSPSRISHKVPSISSMQIRFSKRRESIQYEEDHLLGDFGRQANHIRLECRISEPGFAVQLYVDQDAWIDSRNLVGKLLWSPKAPQHRAEVAGYFGVMPCDVRLRVWRPYSNSCGEWHSHVVVDEPVRQLTHPDEVEWYLNRYRYGEHHLALGTLYEPSDPRISKGSIVGEVLNHFEELYPVFRFTGWTPGNDHRNFAR